MSFVIHDMKAGYEEVVRMVVNGDRVAPRGLATLEVLDVSVVLLDPSLSLPVNIGRKINPRIAAIEALQLIGGVLHPEKLVTATNGAFSAFMDGGTFHGGYGQRTRAQLPMVVQRLKDDPSTRRALMTIWDPLHDLFTEGVHDYPCTIALQFLIRDSKLQLHTHMRSNDVWRGFAYDVFVFTQLQQVVAAVLGIPAGTYVHHATSLHMYETDLLAWEAMLRHPDRDFTPEHFPSLVRPGMSIERAMEIARGILLKDVNIGSHEVDESVLRWYEARV